ncbi:MAG: CGNR zinc finger domain-containing protein [Acidobacteriota bacterium]|nr:CGNR zinc finger domain-containing protein [Acidobacteriota bacterium]
MEPVDRIDYLLDREPAPGRLALVQRFVNTVDREHGREVLASPERLGRLLVELGLLAPGAPVDDEDLGRALELREGLRALALANNGLPAGREAREAVERAADVGRLGVRFDGGVPRLVGTAPGVAGSLATLAAVAATASADGTWSRLKACRRDVCGWLFYDRSRNRSARWCDMAVCGNRTKTRAYRARRR